MRPPFVKGERVVVPGRYRGLVVSECLSTRAGAWVVRAEFESGSGRYEGPAHEFQRANAEVL
jgi:hypothetical protein